MLLKKLLLTIVVSILFFTAFSFNKITVKLEGLKESSTTIFIKNELLTFFSQALDESAIKSKEYIFVLRKNEQLKDGAFAYEVLRKGDKITILLSGEDKTCISHAAYTFLEAIGYRFEISGVTKPSLFDFAILKGGKQKITPFTRWRGIRQHVNFPMDISSYPIDEAKEYLRNLLRLRFNKIAVHSYPNLWHEVRTKDTIIYGGDFFYGRKHEIPQEAVFKKNIRFNQEIFCIPAIEPFYQSAPKRSAMAVSWMKALLMYAKDIGLKVQLSIEPRAAGNMQRIIETCRSVTDEYSMIDELEIITEELGGWGSQCTEAQTKAVLVAQFGQAILKDTLVTAAIKPIQTDLDNLFFQMGRNIEAVKILQTDAAFRQKGISCKIGIYCAIPAYASAAYRLARVYLPETEVSIMPGHGSKRVSINLPTITGKKDDLRKTTVYSWIEFDGLMFTQQNSIEGIYELMKYLKKTCGEEQNQAVLFNHWRTAENRTSARYAAMATLFGPITQTTFYNNYAENLGIKGKQAYSKAMLLLEKIDWMATNDLPNVGFCWVGAWREGGSYTWMNRTNLKLATDLYGNVHDLLSTLLKENNPRSGKDYLSFLENRVSTSSLYLKAFLKATEIQSIKKDSTGNIPEAEQKRAGEICNEALLIFKRYLEKHAEMMPDRGCEGTLINMLHAPIHGLKVIRNKYAHIPLDATIVNENEKDAPPLPIFYKN